MKNKHGNNFTNDNNENQNNVFSKNDGNIKSKSKNGKITSFTKKKKRKSTEKSKENKKITAKRTGKNVNSNDGRVKQKVSFNSVKTDNTEKEKSNKKQLKVMFLGGVGEIGKNMTVLEYNKDIIVIDAGITFPTSSTPGVDLIMPDISYLIKNKNRVRGFIITHGHEDHIGALPIILKELNIPVYGTKLTLTLVENKLRERKVGNAILNCIKAGSVIKLGVFSIEFVNINHSIAGAVALSITTPVGVVFHSGDFKIDYTPVNGETADLTRIAEIGKKGVLLFMADSTNVEIEGTTMSESVVKDTLEHYFNVNRSRRLIIATFASNVHRLQQIIDLAEKYRRKVCFSGRSMINIVDSAEKIGELSVPSGIIVDIEKIKNYKDEEILIITTGTQGEPMSALTRMASGEFNKVVIGANDTIIISASVIPGNEKFIYGVINNLYRLGAEVIYESLEPIHVSGHACKGELRILHNLLRPKFFIPVHGEYRHLKKHEMLAKSLGMKEGTIVIAEIGDCVALTSNTIKKIDSVEAGSKYIDSIGNEIADRLILRDRIHLSEDGMIVAVVLIDEFSYQVNSIEIISKGLISDENYLNEIKNNILSTLSKVDIKSIGDETQISSIIVKNIKNYIFKTIKKNPMILPVVMVV